MRVLSLLAVAFALAGCQSQNPYAAFGPATVPPPGMQPNLPYYPPGAPPPAAQGAAPINTSSPAIPRLSVSAEGTSSTAPSAARFVAEPSDREPIRIVENPAARTAAAAAPRTPATPGAMPAQPAAAQPSYAPAGAVPDYNRTRGYTAPPASGGSSSNLRSDRNVAPAGYSQAAESGGWRAR